MSGADELRRALDDARARVGTLVTERARAVEEARRLRARAGAAPDLGDLEQIAAAYERQAGSLAEAIEHARRTAHEVEVALERARSGGAGAGGADAGGPGAGGGGG